MADSLEQILQPNERVVYRARGAWMASVFLLLLGLFLAAMTLLVASIDLLVFALRGIETTVGEAPGRNVFIAFWAAYAAASLAGAWYLSRGRHAASLVTERRLLHKPAARDAEVAEMALDEIEAIKPGSRRLGSLEVISRTGRALSLDPLHRAGRFATALAAAAGLGAPTKSDGAGGLADLLEPGERLLYRDPPRRWPRPSLPVVVFAACFGGMFWVMLSAFRDASTTMALLTAILLLLTLAAEGYVLATVNARGTTAAVTDRRLVYRLSGLGPNFLDIPIAEIDTVRCLAPAEGAMVTNRQGRSYRLRSLTDPAAFAGRVAEASGAGRPPFDGRLARLAVLAIAPAVLASMIACRLLIEGALGFSIDDNDTVMLLGALPLLLGGIAGLVLGSMAAVAFLRPSATGEEMRAAILALKNRPERPGLVGTWWNGMLLRWAALLYRRPPAPTDEGAKGHGR